MRSPSGIARHLALATALLCVALPAIPQSGTYTVEIIVFRNGGDGGALADDAVLPMTGGDDVGATTIAARKLGGSVSRLNNGGLRVLGHAAWKQAPASWQSRRGASAASLGLAGISGKVMFLRGDRLHLGVDLVVEDGGRRYHISELRQVKADELHYFDHPAVGVLAVVTGD